jgi:hypothetical protein
MPSGVKTGLVVAFAVSLTLVLTARQGLRPIGSPSQITPSTLGRAPLFPPGPLKSPVSVIGAIAVPPFLLQHRHHVGRSDARTAIHC